MSTIRKLSGVALRRTIRIRRGHESLDVTLAYLRARTPSRKKRRNMQTAAAWRTGSLAVGMLRLLSSKLLY